MRRRVGSANAANVRSKLAVEYLTIWLNISRFISACKQFFDFFWLSDQRPVRCDTLACFCGSAVFVGCSSDGADELVLAGSPVPDIDCTSEISELLITPFTVTSSLKLSALSSCPLCDCVGEMSLELTAPFAVVSPTRIDIGMVTLLVTVPSLTANKVI